jgi:glycosyltransferase involved in cell wall biosynthesis
MIAGQAAGYDVGDRSRPFNGVLKVAHVIVGLGPGGAERMLVKLLGAIDRERFPSEVFTLLSIRDAITPEIDALGIPVTSLRMTRVLPDPIALVRLSALLRKSRPHVLQTWMYHADVVGGLAAAMTGQRLPVVWNIRATNPQAAFLRRRTRYLAHVCARMSRWLPQAIICCSAEARRVHVSLGYQDSRIRVIPNGFDIDTFRPDHRARAAVRSELGISAETWVIGMVARFDPHKDHRSFLDAARRLKAVHPDVRFLLCGPNISAANGQLREWIAAAGVDADCHLLGRRQDIPRITAALDIATLSSAEEGFPNVLGEAMSCAVPCVATDVGDSARLIGDTGRVVPPRNPRALADAWHELIALGRPNIRALGTRARRRIAQHFSIDQVARAYEDVYASVGRTEG